MSIIAFGRNSVASTISSEFFELKKVIISEEKKKEHNNLYQEIIDRKIPCEILAKEKFDRHIPDRKHQGIIGFIKRYNYSSIVYLLKRKTSTQFPILIMLDRIEDPHNFGAILRTCAAFDVNGVIISDKNQVLINTTVLKVSTGAVSHIPVCIVSSLEATINILKNNNFRIVSTTCLEEEKEVLDYRYFSPLDPLCIVFGSEHHGVRKNIIKKSHFLLTIPMKNAVNSLNISVSCGIILSSLSLFWQKDSQQSAGS